MWKKQTSNIPSIHIFSKILFQALLYSLLLSKTGIEVTKVTNPITLEMVSASLCVRERKKKMTSLLVSACVCACAHWGWIAGSTEMKLGEIQTRGSRKHYCKEIFQREERAKQTESDSLWSEAEFISDYCNPSTVWKEKTPESLNMERKAEPPFDTQRGRERETERESRSTGSAHSTSELKSVFHLLLLFSAPSSLTLGS